MMAHQRLDLQSLVLSISLNVIQISFVTVVVDDDVITGSSEQKYAYEEVNTFFCTQAHFENQADLVCMFYLPRNLQSFFLSFVDYSFIPAK